MRLYELNENYSNLIQVLESTDDQDIKELIYKSLNELQLDIDSKIENTIKYIKNLEADVEGYATEIKRMTERKKALENSITNLKDYLMYNTKEVNKKKFGTFSVSIRKTKSIKVTNLDIIPIEFQKISIAADKTAIKKAIEQGQIIDGAEIEEKESISIR